MEKITLVADGRLVDAVRRRAVEDKTTLNELFHRWMVDYLGGEEAKQSRPSPTPRRAQSAGGTGYGCLSRNCKNLSTPAGPNPREMK